MRASLCAAALLLSVATTGCGGPPTSSLIAVDQLGDGRSLVVDRVVLAGHDRGWLTVQDADGDRIGIAAISGGVSRQVVVVLDAPVANTSALEVVLHADDHTPGVYEYGDVDGADEPVEHNGEPVRRRLELRVE